MFELSLGFIGIFPGFNFDVCLSINRVHNPSHRSSKNSSFFFVSISSISANVNAFYQGRNMADLLPALSSDDENAQFNDDEEEEEEQMDIVFGGLLVSLYRIVSILFLMQLMKPKYARLGVTDEHC